MNAASHNFDAARSMLPVLPVPRLSHMKRSRPAIRAAALAALAILWLSGAATAQEQRSSPGFLDNLFNRGDAPSPKGQASPPPEGAQVAQGNANDLGSRIDRIENALRQLTGTIEDLQHQNQMLQTQLKRMQDDTEYRFQQLGSRGGPPGAAPPRAMPPQGPANAPANAAPGATPGNRSDLFDPSQHPNAPGAPRVLGNETVAAPPQNATNEPPVGAPGGRDVGAPLDLQTMAGSAPAQPNAPMASAAPIAAAQMPPPARNVNTPGTQLATLPPTASPQDEYDMAYGYILHKDYALAEQAFRDFLRKHPDGKLVPDAQYWLGESMFQRQRYRDAAESFLAVSTKYEHSGKAPESLLRLGQSLAAMNQKEAACATLAEVGRKFPRATASVKRGVTQELKRAHC
jgi:tol-pal system protein YbgF